MWCVVYIHGEHPGGRRTPTPAGGGWADTPAGTGGGQADTPVGAMVRYRGEYIHAYAMGEGGYRVGVGVVRREPHRGGREGTIFKFK